MYPPRTLFLPGGGSGECVGRGGSLLSTSSSFDSGSLKVPETSPRFLSDRSRCLKKRFPYLRLGKIPREVKTRGSSHTLLYGFTYGNGRKIFIWTRTVNGRATGTRQVERPGDKGVDILPLLIWIEDPRIFPKLFNSLYFHETCYYLGFFFCLKQTEP